MMHCTTNSVREGLLPLDGALWRHWSYDVYPRDKILLKTALFPGQKHKLPLLLYSLLPRYFRCWDLADCSLYIIADGSLLRVLLQQSFHQPLVPLLNCIDPYCATRILCYTVSLEDSS